MHFGWADSLLGFLKENRDALQLFYHAHPALAVSLYVAVKALFLVFAVPGVFILTLAAGAIFGLEVGVLAACAGNALGTFGAFLSARFLLRERVERKFGRALRGVHERFNRHGRSFLFAIRLVPLLPHFVINFGLALTRVPARDFFWISLIGMAPGTIVYVNAGTTLTEIHKASDALNPAVLVSFAIAGMIPLLGKLAAARLLKPFEKIL